MEPCRSGSVRVPAFRTSPTGPSAKPRCSGSSNSREGGGGGDNHHHHHPPHPSASTTTTTKTKTSLHPRQGGAATCVGHHHQPYHCASEDTLSHLISIIEQLKSKDKVISQLERELGHPAVQQQTPQQQQLATGPLTAVSEGRRPSGQGSTSSSNSSASSGRMETPTLSPHLALSSLQQVFHKLHGTRMASFPLGGEEKGAVEGCGGLEAETLGLHDRAEALDLDLQTLLVKIKDFEDKNKRLVEKNKRFLEKNIELTAQNRSLKDGNHTMQQQHKKLQEEVEQRGRRQCELARELQRVRGHNLELEAQAREVDSLKKQIADQTSSITLLRQACTDKDRRIELIQHRKKRRRLIRSQEKCQGVKETFYGYDDDENSVNDSSMDSENSLSSVSVSTISEEEACDELSREELERSHRQMLREHLQLERSHALLQAHTGSSQDPYRELQTRSQLQADLFSAQCRVELLEKEIRSLQSKQQRRGSSCRVDGLPDNVDVLALLKERDDLLSARQGLQMKLEQVDGECGRLRQELRKAEEHVEDLEFRILELEENPPCEGHSGDPSFLPPHDNDLDPHPDNDLDTPDLDTGQGRAEETGQAEVEECFTETVAPTAVECQPGHLPASSPSPDQLAAPESSDIMEIERLRRDLKAALEKQGVRADPVLKDLGVLKDVEQKVRSMERMGMEMQQKVISLQQERDGLEERLMRGAPLSLNAEVERRQNLELKDEISHLQEEITRLNCASEECKAEKSCLIKQLDEIKHLNISLQEQIKEFLEPSGSQEICSASILLSNQQNKTDLEKVDADANKRIAPRSNKHVQTDKSPDSKKRDKNSRSRSRDKERAEMQALAQKVKTLQDQVKQLDAENSELREKSTRASADSSSDEEDPSQPSIKHTPKHKVKTLERHLKVLQSENMRLADKIEGFSPGSRLNPEEVIERIVELEDHCTDLQDRMHETEGHERQIRDKLRVAEQTINELEQSEAHYRDKCDELYQQEREAKKQLHSLQTTGRELREIILDKEILEQALKEKVEFLEKVEEQSSQRITELEALEKSLREQLESRDRAGGGADPVLLSLREKLSTAEQEVKTLRERNNELEENEEILRENWRRVADEDANRLKCLEEKVRMLDLTNQDLKNKLAEAQDFVVINSAPPAQGSLADELSASSRGRTQARPHSDSPVSVDSDDESGEDSPKKKVQKLQRQLSLLEEEKNGKIAGLQERLADMRDNEIKLSETLVEMEMTERELRAKLALYESSEVTVEKMLKYQDKIDELRTSQESLLDQLETMESQEVTLQERLEETERRLKGKIVTLEVELKNLKQKEHKANARVRELEKLEEELTEKAKKQAEKENGLYVRISGLMDQVKEHKAKISEQEVKLAEKEERCRKVASLEAKFLQIDGGYREKVTALESTLAETQSSLEEEGRQHAETRRMLDNIVESREKEHSQRVFILEEMFAQKEKGLKENITSLEASLADRDRTVSRHEKELHDKDDRITELQEELGVRDSRISELEENASSQQSEVERIGNMEKDLSDRDVRIDALQKDLVEKESCISKLQNDVSALQDDLVEREYVVADLEKTVSEKAARISELEKDLSSKESRIAEAEKDAHEIDNLKTQLAERDRQVGELENKFSEKLSYIGTLEQDVGRLESHVDQLEKGVSEKEVQITGLNKELSDKVAIVSQLETDQARKNAYISRIVQDIGEKDTKIDLLQAEVSEKASHVAELETRLKDRQHQIEDLEAVLEAKDHETANKLKEAHQEMSSRDSHIAEMEERVIHTTSVMSELEKKLSEKDTLISGLETQLIDKDTIHSERVTELQSKLETEQKSASTKQSSLDDELVAVKMHLSQSSAKSEEYSRKLELVVNELEEEKKNVHTLKLHSESLVAEKDSLQAELMDRVEGLEAQLREQENDFQAQMSVRESEFHQACSSLDTECESLRGDLIEKGKVIEKLESTKNDLLSKIENLKDSERELSSKVSSLELDLSTLHMLKDSEIQDAALIWENRVKQSEQEKETALEKASSAERDLLSSENRLQQQLEERKQLEAQLKEARSEAETLQATLAQLQLQEKESSTQREVLLEQEVMLKSRMSQVEAELQARSRDQQAQQGNVSELLLQKQNLEEALEKLKTDLSHSQAENAHLQESVSQLTQHRKSVQEELASLQPLIKELEVYQKREKDIHRLLQEEKDRMRELESEISCLKDEKRAALAEAGKLQVELDLSKETITKLESDISALGQVEKALKSQIAAEQSARLEADRKLGEATEEAAASQEKAVQLLQEANERDEELDKLKVELSSLRRELQAQQELSVQEKDQELHSRKEKEVLKKREADLQERVRAMESQMVRHQEDHSHMCQKLQEQEKREKELLEQITDIEQSVIVPLEAENAELKEEVAGLKQQNEALNLQLDKQEEQTGEDSLELAALRTTVNDLQLARTEALSKLDRVTQEFQQQQSENEVLQHKLTDLEALNNDLKEQLEHSKTEVDKLEGELCKDLSDRDAQTDLDTMVSEAEWKRLQQKLTVLQDAESKFVSRIFDLEEQVEQLGEELQSAKLLLKTKDQHSQQSKESFSHGQVGSDGTDASVDTEDLQETNSAKVPELFARVQELESANQRLSINLEQATAGETDRRQLTDRLQLLEKAEDRLMERVMELEENDVTLRTQLDRFRHRATAADKLEEEVSLLLQQEDEWKDKVSTLTAENAELSEKLQSLHSRFGHEQSKNDDLAFRVEADQRQLQDAQTELKLVQAKLQAVRSEYEEKLSALEESEKKIESQLDNQSQRESDLRREIQVLREEMEDVCERYKELELENSRLKQEHSKVLVELKEAESRCSQLAGGVSREPTVQAAQAQSLQAVLPSGKSLSSSNVSSPDPQYSSPPQVCSKLTLQMVPSSQQSVHKVKTTDGRTYTTQPKRDLKGAHLESGAGAHLPYRQSSMDSSDEYSDASSVHSASTQSVKVLTLHDALEENASLKAQLQDLRSRSQSVSEDDTPALSGSAQNAETLHLQTEVRRLESQVRELQRSLKEAEGAVQEVVTVVRTRSVHTLEQKIETIQHTIHTQSPAWSLHQELLELLTSQADLQKQVSHLMETEHNLRSTLKQVEDELARAKSGAGASTLGARRVESDRRFGLQSRLSRFGGGISSTKPQTEGSRSPVDSSKKTKEQWLERQVADLQLGKTNLERRLHEAERRLAFRPRPTSASRDELLFRIEQLQEEQGEWRKKVEDLEALNSHYLKEKLELASERDSLEHRLQTQSPSISKEVSLLFTAGRREEPLGSSGSLSEGEPGSVPPSSEKTLDSDSDTAAMLEKPEDVLQKRIKELENLESYLRQQLSEVESDRDQLHELTRKDKALIHEQNVRLRELSLQERSLRSQVSGLEDSERSLYTRTTELEDTVARLEDRVHELEVHERKLRELVRKLKLDEEVWLSKSGDLTASMEQLSSSEVSLRKMVQDLQLEKGGLADRAEYLEVRVKELESLETTLVQRLKNYENVEASLTNRLQHTENSEAAAHSKASELDVINMDLSSRLQRAVEENAVLSQHVAQQQGQIHDMDRKLSAASDAQVSMSQHVDSLQKSEALLQKKVREYELRDIDAQARVRELEQTEEILKDKINQLQRSENRLKSRLVEFETVGSQVLENLPPAQKQQLPQQLEECQKRVVVLQRQLDAAQAELNRLRVAEEDDDEATSVRVPTAALTELRSKVALLEETEYQNSELEKLNAQLGENILLLRQGKGSCGHEVELEVLKRRLHSYQNTVQKLKHHLSEGQVPSLRAADQGQGPESEDLPARDLQCLESERVLHSVRSLTTQPPGLPHAHQDIVQAHSGTLQAGRAPGVASAASEPLEESHWRRVELRRQAEQEAEPRGASASMPHASATPSNALPHQEELVIGLSLPSESERESFKSQNDTDSEMSGVTATRPNLRMVGSTTHQRGAISTPSSGAVPALRGGGRGEEAPPPPMPTTTTQPPTTTTPLAQQQHANSGFVTDDSFYLPSSAQSESESQEEGEAPPLPSSAPPGSSSALPPSLPRTSPSQKSFVSSVTLASAGGQKGGEGVKRGEGTGERSQTTPLQPALQTTSAVGLSIRQRIAQIERQLKENPSSKAGSKAEEDDVFTWKAKATENARLLGAAERESKQLKEDINKLEKDLEEKRRYIYIFEKWILDAEEVLKNKNKKNDRDLVQQLQTEVKHLKQDLGNAGYRKDDIFTDPAALRTELDRKDRELTAKRSELDSVIEEAERWRREAGSVEAMRRNALDALRLLETEVTQLQDADTQLKHIKDDYNTLRGQYDEVNIQKNKAVTAVHALRAKVTRLAKKCQEKDELLRRLSEEVRGGQRGRSSSLLEELTRLEALAGGEEYNRPLSPLDLITGPAMSDTERLLSERIPQPPPFTRWASSSSLGDPRDLSAGDLHRSSSGGDKAPLSRPKSAELAKRGQHPGDGRDSSGFTDTVCVALLDYEPDAASRSGHRHLELPLKEGDQVLIRGPVDRHGYCEAEVGGRTGLVPASHLYPLSDSGASYRLPAHKQGRFKKSGGDSAEQIVQMFEELQDPRLVLGVPHHYTTSKTQHSAHSAATQTRQRRSVSKIGAAPEAPTGLYVKEVDGSSVVLAWQPPTLDQNGCSNGCKVVGYRIYLNGRVCQQPHNPRLSQTRVEGVRHERPQQLAIQTLAASGQLSARVELVYQGGASSSLVHREEDDRESDTDLSSILNSIQYKTGKKRTVMGLYDYDPEKQSPGDYPACELAFSAGDTMLVYGDERQDGFYHGERNGRRGLVPACFVEPVVQGAKSTQKPGASNGTASPQS